MSERYSNKKVLVVEDNYMNKVLIREMLVLQGYDVIDADSGNEAIEKAKSEKPDLILMDIHLPGIDGIEAMKTIKSDPEMLSIPIIAVTASAMKGDEERIRREGFDGYIPKPIEVKVLIDVISKFKGVSPED